MEVAAQANEEGEAQETGKGCQVVLFLGNFLFIQKLRQEWARPDSNR
ncbi:unnamed protein product [marine sediment metagenome]|uniref:Uncharacterized protein n=1 Tax=marine sediment metagenome TaxID=412755 RepID=X0WVI3_9ZZZZ